MELEKVYDYQKIYAIIRNCTFIAAIHNSAKVWVLYTQYTISEINTGDCLIIGWIFILAPDILSAFGGIIHLKYTGCFLNG